MSKLIRAMTFAENKHGETLDDENKPYLDHVFMVGNLIQKLTNDEDVISAAFLHDTIEDTDTTYEELVEHFGKRTADLVNEVTHEGKKDEYGYYFPRLKSKDGILIKLVDRAHNVSRMNCWSEQRQRQYLNKTKFWKDGSDRK